MKKLSKTSLYRSDTLEAFVARCAGSDYGACWTPCSCYCTGSSGYSMETNLYNEYDWDMHDSIAHGADMYSYSMGGYC